MDKILSTVTSNPPKVVVIQEDDIRDYFDLDDEDCFPPGYWDGEGEDDDWELGFDPYYY